MKPTASIVSILLLGMSLQGRVFANPSRPTQWKADTGLTWALAEAPVAGVLREDELKPVAEPLEGEASPEVVSMMAMPLAGVLGLARDDFDYMKRMRNRRILQQIVPPRIQAELDPALEAGATDLGTSSTDDTGGESLSRQPVSRAPEAVYFKLPGLATRTDSFYQPPVLDPVLSLASPRSAPVQVAQAVSEPDSATYTLTGLRSGNPIQQPMAPATEVMQVVESGNRWNLQSFNAQPTALINQDPFGSLGGWQSRDGEMTVALNGSAGNPGGAMEGTFASQVFPIPQTDSFRLDSGSATPTQALNFLGDYRYIGLNPDRVSWVFDFKAEDVLPSDLVFRFSDGTSTFFYPFASSITQVGEWTKVYVPLRYDMGWVGGNATLFDIARQNVDSIEIQVTRNGTGFQQYYVDNLEVVDFSIPEPRTMAFLLVGSLCMLTRRWVTNRQRRALVEIEPVAS